MRNPIPERVRSSGRPIFTDLAQYRAAYERARVDPSGFWLDVTRERIAWRRTPTLGLEGDFTSVAERQIAWFRDGTLNVNDSCLDRHLGVRGDKTAIIWEADEPADGRRISYRELHRDVCKAANVLADLGVRRGDRVVIYMGMVPELAVAMLACARLGAVHSVVFAGFSAQALRERIEDSRAEVVITQDVGYRGGKTIPLKQIADEACAAVRKVLVFKRTTAEVGFVPGRDVWWHEAMASASAEHEAVAVGAEDPLFIMYTSGSTGRPKGLVHTTGGYLTYASFTHAAVFALGEDDVHACVADLGWITAHTYAVYGPLANGATTLLFESTPVYPDPGRYWDMAARHKLATLFSAPTALRTLAAADPAYVKKHDRSSLRILATAGEPISPETWRWYSDVVGEGRCAIADNYWQTETGGMCITPIPTVTPTKPGSATLPMIGIVPALRDEKGVVLEGPGAGRLCFEQPWPAQARTIWGDHARFVQTYFTTFPGVYFSGDGCRRDEDGYFWITGRVDDVLNVSGHRIGTAEIESALATVASVAESAVVGYPHDVKGQGVYAYVVGKGAVDIAALNEACRRTIGAHAKIDKLQVVAGLPKTRSGKVMRRILRKIAEGESDGFGDLTTLADPAVVEAILAGRK